MGILQSLSDEQKKMFIKGILSTITPFTAQEIEAALNKDQNLKLDELFRAVIRTPMQDATARAIKVSFMAGYLGGDIISDEEIRHLIYDSPNTEDSVLLLVLFWTANREKMEQCFKEGKPLINVHYPK